MAFRARVRGRVCSQAGTRARSGAGFDAAWDSVRLQSVRAGRAHCELTMARNFAAGVRGAPKVRVLPLPRRSYDAFSHVHARAAGQALQPVLARLCALHLLTVLEADPADLLASGYLAPHQVTRMRRHSAPRSARGLTACLPPCAQLPWLRRATLAQVRALRPDAVPLADGFGLSDRLLNSALGRYDGRCYEALYAWAQREPMNAKQVRGAAAAGGADGATLMLCDLPPLPLRCCHCRCCPPSRSICVRCCSSECGRPPSCDAATRQLSRVRCSRLGVRQESLVLVRDCCNRAVRP